MTGKKLEADYLVIGGGAMGMAFTDVLMTETDADAELQAWLRHSRLDFLSGSDALSAVDGELAQRLAAGAEAAVAKLQRWLAEADAETSGESHG